MAKRRHLRLASVLTTTAALTAAALLGTPSTASAAQTGTTDTSVAPALAAQAALVVGGTTFPSMSEAFMSLFTTTFAPTLINVPYPATIAPPFDGPDTLGASVSAGVNSLLGLINTTYSAGNNLVVWGISQGALVLDVTQQLLANDPSAPPPSALTFVRVADPAQVRTGMLNFAPNIALSTLLHFYMRTAPSESQYNTIIITNQYDGFADFPDKWDPLAVINSFVGLYYRHGQTAFVDLSSVPDKNVTTSINSLGATTTTYLVPATFLPITQPLRDLGVPSPFVDALDNILRPKIDAGYTRNDPPGLETQYRGSRTRTSARVPAVPTAGPAAVRASVAGSVSPAASRASHSTAARRSR